jgi:hypothetical protein
MNFSNQLIDKYKESCGAKSDAATAANVPNMTRMNLSAIRKGERHLTEEQALWLASECQIDSAMVLVELAAETSRSENAKDVWVKLAKKLKATALASAVAIYLMVSGASGPISPQRIKNIP